MKHVTFADKSLLTGNETADLILEYATLLARAGDADSVSIEAIGPYGSAVTATMLLADGSPLMAESTTSDLPDPDNEIVEQYLREQIASRRNPPQVVVPDARASSVEPVTDFDM